jgi:hypothetical protein
VNRRAPASPRAKGSVKLTEHPRQRDLARQLLGGLHQGMQLADRGFYSYGPWSAAAATRAHLLWRAGNNLEEIEESPHRFRTRTVYVGDS